MHFLVCRENKQESMSLPVVQDQLLAGTYVLWKFSFLSLHVMGGVIGY